MGHTIRRLAIGDTSAFIALRREALESEPLAFGASIEDDRGLDPDFVAQMLEGRGESVVFGAFADGLVGAVGVRGESQRKASHKAQLWGMYVRPAARRADVGGALLSAAIAHAKGMAGIRQIQLSVSETAAAALRLYERHGFVVWGTEPAALGHAGRFVAEHHLALALPDRPATRARRSRSRSGMMG